MSSSVGLYGALRRVAFAIDAERVHRLAMTGLSAWSGVCSVKRAPGDVAAAPELAREVCGVRFPNPLGLAAGFDKDAECVPAWGALGFGFVEVGTVTQHPQPGNPKPRLFRLPADQALLNRLGFNNLGAEHAAKRLAHLRAKGRVGIPVGVNIGKSKVTPVDAAAADYAFSFERCADVADYIVVNVSSPNTPGLRDLQNIDALRAIIDPLVQMNSARRASVPLFVKVAPDLSDDDAIDIARLAKDGGVSGLIVSNTTISREGLKGPVPEGPGGISGRPVWSRSTALLRLLRAEVGSELAFIAVGGVFDGDDVVEKLAAGADLVQAYTGFVYGGPGFARRCLHTVRAASQRPALTA